MSRYLFDIETDGLLDTLTQVHSIVLKDIDTGQVFSCHDHYHETEGEIGPDIEEGVEMLAGADMIIGHNVIGFDIPALQKVFPDFRVDQDKVRDTLVWSRLVYPKDVLRDYDLRRLDKINFPSNELIASHGLEAWGHRLKIYKGDFGKTTDWSEWTPEMQSYCEQDVEVTEALFKKLKKASFKKERDGRAFPAEAIQLEHDVSWIISRQLRHGVLFHLKAAMELIGTLSTRRAEIEAKLKREVKGWFKDNGVITPKTKNRKLHRMAGCPLTRIEWVPFNPGSRPQVIRLFKEKYDWKPTEFTEKGQPKIDETVLGGLDYPEAGLLSELFLIIKLLGYLAEGDNAWIKLVEDDGRIRGYVNSNGARTGRMTHSNPNLANVPSSRTKFGHEIRALFGVPDDKVLIGCDADGLELRCLAGYMAPFDGGEYIKTVLEGDKSKGTDMHSVNCRAIGMDSTALYPAAGKTINGREIAKTWFYAFIYGGGDLKLGLIQGIMGTDAKIRRVGKAGRERFLNGLPALKKLVENTKKMAKELGYLRGLDGRKLICPSPHSSLNTLLQSAGALLMKRALVILDRCLQEIHGLVPGIDYEFVLNVHDEWQIEALRQHADLIMKEAVDAITAAGVSFDFGCPLAGNADVGSSWAETH